MLQLKADLLARIVLLLKMMIHTNFPASSLRKNLPHLMKSNQVSVPGFLVFVSLKVFNFSLVFLLNCSLALMVTLLLNGQSPLRGSYNPVYVLVLALVTDCRTVIFGFVMDRNCKNLATLAHSIGVTLSRSVQFPVIEVNHLFGIDKVIVLQSSHGQLPTCFDCQLSACYVRMPQQWAGTLEASTSL